MPRKNNTYNKELKLRAIDMYLNQHIGANTIAKVGLKCKNQVYQWVKLYHKKGETALNQETRGKKKGPRKGRPKTKFASLEEEIQHLRMENEF